MVPRGALRQAEAVGGGVPGAEGGAADLARLEDRAYDRKPQITEELWSSGVKRIQKVDVSTIMAHYVTLMCPNTIRASKKCLTQSSKSPNASETALNAETSNSTPKGLLSTTPRDLSEYMWRQDSVVAVYIRDGLSKYLTPAG